MLPLVAPICTLMLLDCRITLTHTQATCLNIRDFSAVKVLLLLLDEGGKVCPQADTLC